VVHFRDDFLSFLRCAISWFKNNFFITMLKRSCSIFQPIFPHFSDILADQGLILLPEVIESAILSIAFCDDTGSQRNVSAGLHCQHCIIVT